MVTFTKTEACVARVESERVAFTVIVAGPSGAFAETCTGKFPVAPACRIELLGSRKDDGPLRLTVALLEEPRTGTNCTLTVNVLPWASSAGELCVVAGVTLSVNGKSTFTNTVEVCTRLPEVP